MPDIRPPQPFVIRRAHPADQQPLADVIRARSVWMRERGLPDWFTAADELAAQAAQPHTPVWVLTHSGNVIGCTSLYHESPAWFWTERERVEPAIFMASTVTHPRYAGQRLGCQIAWWVLDHAASTGQTWVRRGTIEPDLVRYYRDVQGWQIIRQKMRDGLTVTGLARRATAISGLAVGLEADANTPPSWVAKTSATPEISATA